MVDWAGGYYWTTSEWCRHVIEVQQGRESWNYEGRSGRLTVPMLYRQQGSAPLVVLDEIGTREKASDHHYECVKDLIDCREGIPLIVIGNMPLDNIAAIYDSRVVSRLACGTVFDTDKLPDLRVEK